MSLTNATSNQLYATAHNTYNASKGAGVVPFLQRNVTCRAAYLLATMISPVTSSVDLMAGTALGAISILTFAVLRPLNYKATTMIQDGGIGLLSGTFIRLIRTVNPNADTTITEVGDFTQSIRDKLQDIADEYIFSKNIFENQVLSRIAYLAGVPVAIVTRVVDLAIGLFAALGALILCGTNKKLNHYAIEGLKATLVISDIYFGLLDVVNPKAAW